MHGNFIFAVMCVSAWLCFTVSARAEESPLPRGAEPPPVAVPHFPDPLHALVWRNWQLVSPEVLAQTVGATAQDIEAIAASMGLPPATTIAPEWRRRGYITIVRRNWRLVPYEQLLTLVDMMPDELAEALREDDFLYIKLGSLKPRREPDAATRERAAEIARIVSKHFGDSPTMARERPFEFISNLSKLPASPASAQARDASENGPESQSSSPRFIYSYFGVFGDPLASLLCRRRSA